MTKTVAIVHFNTPDLLEALIRSIRKQGGEEYQIVIFENSNERPFTKRMKGVRVIDNTKGQLVDFDAELAKWKKDKDQGYSKGCNFGSVKHMLSVEWLMQNMEEPFVLMDSDILLKAPIDDMFDDQYTAIGATDSGMNVYGISRMIPFLCYINAPECRRLGLHYFDPDRAWAIIGGKVLDGKHYDTGASFNEDLKKCPQAKVKHIDITKKMIHMGSGSTWDIGFLPST